MHSLFILAAALVLSGAAPAPDFSWAGDHPAHRHLREARAAWGTASAPPASAPGAKPGDPPARFDEAYLRSLLRSGSPDAAVPLLDDAMRRQKALDKCKEFYEKAAAAIPRSDASRARLGGFLDAYHRVRCTIRLAVGLSRAGISRAMASAQNPSYCFQAMESAIDALKDASDEARSTAGGAKRAQSISRLRTSLLAAWERAQRAKDPGLIRDFDLLGAFDDAFPQPPPAKCPAGTSVTP